MDAPSWLTAAHVIVVAGKGGVGKTTVTAAVATAAARSGHSTHVIAVDDRPGLGPLLGGNDLTVDSSVLAPATGDRAAISGRLVRPDSALLGYLDDHGMTRLARKFIATGAVDVLATTTPGIKDLLVLGKIRALEQERVADVIVVDAPAAGHAITFLQSPQKLREVVGGGPIASQADEALALLADPSRCQVVIVTLPEETPVNEAAHVAFELEEKVGVKLGPVVVNRCRPVDPLVPESPRKIAGLADLDAPTAAVLTATAERVAREQQRQIEQTTRLDELLPLPQIHLPRRYTAELTSDDIEVLADHLTMTQVPTP